MHPREAAVSIAVQLRKAGHEALLAGGCVRDEAIGRVPKDWDVATSATPDEVRSVFRACKGVGEAFGVILVHRGGFATEGDRDPTELRPRCRRRRHNTQIAQIKAESKSL